MSGTASDQAASDQSSPLVLNSRNCTHPCAEGDERREQHASGPRESGVVFGSEIMKKVKSSSAPLSSRWSGIVSGSPRYDRAAEQQRAVERDERVGHVRARRAVDDDAADAGHEEARRTPPMPHCPGDTQA